MREESERERAKEREKRRGAKRGVVVDGCWRQ